MKNDTKINKMIAKAIIKAQAASDSGKGFDDGYTSNRHQTRGPGHMGYAVKADLIERAIKMIANSKESAFTFYVINEGWSLITYFEYREWGKVWQASFHTPEWDSGFGQLKKWVGKGTPTEWNQEIYGSSFTCYHLAWRFRI